MTHLRSWLTGVAFLVAASGLLIYVIVLHNEGQGDLGTSRAQFFIFVIAAALILAVVGLALDRPRLRLTLLSASGFAFTLMTLIGIFSIGLLMFPAAAAALIASSSAVDRIGPRDAWILVALTGLAAAGTFAAGVRFTA